MYWVISAFDCLRAAWYGFKNMRGEIGWNGFVAIVRFTSFTFALLQSLLPLFAGLFLLAVSPNEYGVSLYLIYYIIIGRFRTSKIQYSYKSSFVGEFAKVFHEVPCHWIWVAQDRCYHCRVLRVATERGGAREQRIHRGRTKIDPSCQEMRDNIRRTLMTQAGCCAVCHGLGFLQHALTLSKARQKISQR